jgi:hypothetical protein
MLENKLCNITKLSVLMAIFIAFSSSLCAAQLPTNDSWVKDEEGIYTLEDGVGVATDNPAARLDVNGSISVNGVEIVNQEGIWVAEDSSPGGTKGPVGDPGPQGPVGDAGPQGVAGVQGDVGATGVTGAKGAKGDTGARGSIGATGSKGPRGDRGDSEYPSHCVYRGTKYPVGYHCRVRSSCVTYSSLNETCSCQSDPVSAKWSCQNRHIGHATTCPPVC